MSEAAEKTLVPGERLERAISAVRVRSVWPLALGLCLINLALLTAGYELSSLAIGVSGAIWGAFAIRQTYVLVTDQRIGFVRPHAFRPANSSFEEGLGLGSIASVTVEKKMISTRLEIRTIEGKRRRFNVMTHWRDDARAFADSFGSSAPEGLDATSGSE